MESVEIVALETNKHWKRVARKVGAVKAPTGKDVTIVLGGCVENPVFPGRKLLAFDGNEWEPHPYLWEEYKAVLDEYYAGYYDMTGMTIPQKVSALKQHIEELSHAT